MAKIFGIFIWLSCILLSPRVAVAQLQLNNQDSYSLNGYVYEFTEKTGSINQDEALQNFKQHLFTKVPTSNNEFYRPLVQQVYWLAIPVKAPMSGSKDLEAGVANSGIYHVEYYLMDMATGKTLKKHVTGKHYSFFSREVKCRHYYFPAQLKPNEQGLILFRLDKRGDGLNAPLRLLQRSYRQQAEFRSYFQYAFFFGLMMFVSFFSLVSFLWTKDSIYLYHSLYVLCCCLFFLADGDLDYEWLYPNWPAWASIASSLYAIAIVFFMLLFMADFLQLKSAHPRLFKLSRLCTLAIGSLFILVPLGYALGKNVNIRVFIYYYGLVCVSSGWMLSIYCILRRMIDRHRPAYLYGLAIISVILAAVFYILKSLAITAHNFIPFNYLLTGFGIEIIILSFALIYSFNHYKKKHYELSISLAKEQLNFGEQLLLSQQAEQQRIARDLHDELGGSLAAMKVTLQRFNEQDEKLTLLNYLVDTASDSTRNIAHNLMPPGLESTSLPEVLDKYYRYLNSNAKVHFQFYCSGANDSFTKQQELIIYRIVLELTNNISRHSGASEGTLQLIYNHTHLEIMAEDNGSGFDLQKQRNGMGLENIKARAGYLNGKVNIDTGPNGTTVIINIPYKQDYDAD